MSACGSSIMTNRLDKSRASTGQIATHAAQPKQRPPHLVKGFLLRALALVAGSGCPTQTHPDPFVSIGRFWTGKRSDKMSCILNQLAIFIEPMPLLAHSHWALLFESIYCPNLSSGNGVSSQRTTEKFDLERNIRYCHGALFAGPYHIISG